MDLGGDRGKSGNEYAQNLLYEFLKESMKYLKNQNITSDKH